jgi:hypothetical protein
MVFSAPFNNWSFFKKNANSILTNFRYNFSLSYYKQSIKRLLHPPPTIKRLRSAHLLTLHNLQFNNLNNVILQFRLIILKLVYTSLVFFLGNRIVFKFLSSDCRSHIRSINRHYNNFRSLNFVKISNFTEDFLEFKISCVRSVLDFKFRCFYCFNYNFTRSK